ncbi:hypothetical protein [Streptomyces sp. NPDC015345]|uniref:hypothetical protein n=1 Tax=Streptomyces sp. NPDC015345 TaxID=3364953 RepID=UPI0037024DCD
MTATLRQRANTVANSMIEGASMSSALIGGAAGAYLGYQLDALPDLAFDHAEIVAAAANR